LTSYLIETKKMDIDIIDIFNETTLSEILSLEDVANLEIEIHQWIHSYMEENISKLPRPDFMDTLVDELMEDICTPLIDSSEEDLDYDEFEYIVSFFIQNYFKIGYPDAMPPRYSLKHWKQKKTDVEREQIREKLEKVSNAPQPVQRTSEWYKMRYNLITASNIWKAFGSAANKNSIIYEKCRPLIMSDTEKVNVLSATHWGVKYEPITVMLYEKLFKTKIGEFGCIQHPAYSFIGASPDGINIDPESPKYGTMLEIKNIVNREIDGNPKLEYWVQTQVQMEVCDLEDCDFVETQFKEYEDGQEDLFYSNKDNYLANGVILYFIDRGFGNERPHYVYMPLDTDLSRESVDSWITEQKELLAKDYVLFRRIYWYCEIFSCVNIHRNRQWFQSVLPEIESVWRIIEYEREHGHEHRKPVVKIPKLKKLAPPPSSLFDDFKHTEEKEEEKLVAKPIVKTNSNTTVVTTTVNDDNFFEGDILKI